MGKSDLRIFIGADASNFNKNIKAAQTQLVNFGNVAKSVGSSIKTALVGAFAIDSAQRFFDQVISAGSGFEHQMSRVKAVAGATTNELKMMTAEAMRLGSTTRYSASEAAKALENLTRNGLDARKATRALSSVLELAGANAIGLAEAADILTNTMNMFRLEVEDLNEVNDILSKTAARSATDITSLYHALSYAAPNAAQLYIEIDEVNAALGILANNGIKGERAGTALRALFERLVNPTRESEQALKSYGLEINETTLKVDGLIGTLQKLQSAGMSQRDLGIVFGTMASGPANIMINNVGNIENLKNELANSQGAAQQMFNEGVGGFKKSVDNLKSTFESAMINVFEAIKPALTSSINAVTDFIKAISDLPTVLVTAGAALTGFGLKSLAEFIGNVQKSRKELEITRKGYNDAIETFSKLDLSIDLGDTYVPAKNLSEQSAELKKIQKQANDVGLSFDFLNEAIKATDSSSLQGVYNKLEKIQHIADGVGVPFKALESLMYDSAADIDSTIKQIDRELKNLQEDSTNPETKKYFQNLRKEIRGFKGEMMDTGPVTKYRASLNNLNDGLDSLPKKTSLVRASFNKLKDVCKSGLSSILSFFGGPITIAITALVTAIGFAYSNFRKLGEAAREANKAMKEVSMQNTKLKTSFVGVVNELRHLEKGSVAWESRIKHLKSEYPDLVDELRLSEMDINSSAEAWDNLAASMQKVIEKQAKLNFAETATQQRDQLNQTYLNNDFGWFVDTYLSKLEETIRDRHVDSIDDPNKREDAEVQLRFFIQELGAALTQFYKEDNEKGNDAQKIFAVDAVLKKMDKYFGTNYGANPATGINLVTDYNKRVGNEVKALSKWLNGQTHTNNLTEMDIVDYLDQQTKIFEEQKKSIQKEAELKFPDGGKEQADYIATETQRFAAQILDTILEKFRGIKIGGIDARDFLQDNQFFNQIVKAAQVKPIGKTGGGEVDPQKLLTWNIEGWAQQEAKGMNNALRKAIESGDKIPIKNIPIEIDEEVFEAAIPEYKDYETGSLRDLQDRISIIRYKIESTSDDATIDKLKEELDKLTKEEQKIIVKIDGVDGMPEAFGSIADMFGEAQRAAEKFGDEGLAKAMQSLSSTALFAQAIAALVKTLMTCVTPWDYIAAISAGVASTIAAFASMPAFANGGIVGGNSTVGDHNLVRVNSGEMILNNRQQRNLFNLLNGNNSTSINSNQVTFKIQGKELVGVLNNYNNQKSKVR